MIGVEEEGKPLHLVQPTEVARLHLGGRVEEAGEAARVLVRVRVRVRVRGRVRVRVRVRPPG